MRRNTVIQLIALALGLVALAGSGVLATGLSASAGRNKLVFTDRAVEGDPPQVGVGIAMGAFRGLFVNMLWMRANDAKEKGRYHEAMDLARAITALQPRFEEVWVFHAWNMAYNISVTSQSPQERWRWVDKGVRLLRDEGVVYNPNSLLIHKELAWIFLHKIGGYTDDSNRYYKRALAAEWTEILGPPPPPAPLERSRQGATDAYVAWLSPIARAPRTLAGVYEAEPSARDLVEQIREHITTKLDARFLERYTTARALADSIYENLDIPMGPKSAAMMVLVTDADRAAAWAALLPYVRRTVLEREYHMDPQRMVRYTRKYGPIDWRHPAAHGLYWSTKGVEAAIRRMDERTKKDFDIINSDRVVIQSIQELYRSGEIYFSYLNWKIPELRPGGTSGEGTGYVFYQGVPNAHFVDTYSEVVNEIAERAKLAGKSWAESDKRVFTLYAAGYENFLQDAIRFFYRRGQIDKANEYHAKLLTYERININYSARGDELGQDLESFIADQFENERYASPYVANSEVEAALQSAWINGLLAGDNEMFRRNLGYAQRFHRAYSDKQIKAVAAGQAYERQAVMEPDFRMLAGMSFARTIASLDIADAEAIYNRAPEDLKQFGFWVLQDIIGSAANASVALGGRAFAEVFPEPEGWSAFTSWLARKIDERSRPLQEGPSG